jgi:uncharacterized membrane protein YphA (DoxX/SURF4 family)
MKKIFALISIFVTSPSLAFAHVKWFVDSEEVIKNNHNITPFYYIDSSEVLIWSGILLVVVLLAGIIDKHIKEPKAIVELARKNDRKITRSVEILLGIFLVCITLMWNVIISPDLPIASISTLILATLQLFVGVFLIFGVIPRVTSSILLFIYIAFVIMVGWLVGLENLVSAVLAIYIFIKNSPEEIYISKYKNYAVEIVRVGAAVSLITLAFTEKLMYPELALAFLSEHNWNFMQIMGMTWFTDNLFVLSAGFAEIIFGLLYLFGYLTRINTLVMSGFFATSVFTMLISFNKWEVEDLVIYAAAIIFMFYGNGGTKFFHIRNR